MFSDASLSTAQFNCFSLHFTLTIHPFVCIQYLIKNDTQQPVGWKATGKAESRERRQSYENMLLQLSSSPKTPCREALRRAINNVYPLHTEGENRPPASRSALAGEHVQCLWNKIGKIKTHTCRKQEEDPNTEK